MKNKITLKHRSDYAAPDYGVDTVELDFSLDKNKTAVKTKLEILPKSTFKGEIFLNGEELDLSYVKINGKKLTSKDYKLAKEGITLSKLPKDNFTIETLVYINPEANTRLSGLYISNGLYCTQCEPEGFRRITFYPDHPDIMAKFKTVIRGDRKAFPVMLSNGNLIEEAQDYVVFEDPFAKPSYLFALVAADLAFLEDSFITMSGRKTTLRIYAEHGKEKKLSYAMASLKKAMEWDEKAFGREYDLDLFNIVAVSDFNAAAMENKSLNIFCDKYVLADPETATDADYANIEATIAHEYFHNWSGDRVTARDWFNLSLKEGLTVYREQEFSADMHSRAVKRINDVIYLRSVQFPEDAGPLAHSVRPDTYMAIDNFYTSTVYSKGAELIRMQEKILGKELFRKANDLYYSRHDGQAVTIDDYVKCMEDTAEIDLTQFKRWYSQAGTPKVKVSGIYDEEAKTYTLHMLQHTEPTPNQPVKEPFVIPIEVGLISPSGAEMPLYLAKKAGDKKKTSKITEGNTNSMVLLLDKKEADFVFENVEEPPVPSLNRDFTSPIKVEFDYSDEELAFLMAFDANLFNRFEAGQEYAIRYILSSYQDIKNGQNPRIDERFIKAFGSYLYIEDDDFFVASALSLPSEKYLYSMLNDIDVDALHKAHRHVRGLFARTFKDKLWQIYNEKMVENPFDISPISVHKRALRNRVLAYLGILRDDDTDKLVAKHYVNAVNMTDIQSSLTIMLNNRIGGFDDALGDFYHNFKDDALVINKWFSLQAWAEENQNVLADVKKLTEHEAFSFTNPTKVYALIGGFCSNLVHFHAKDGQGYDFLADIVIELDAVNPMVASHMATLFGDWRRLELERREKVEITLNRILAKQGLSKEVTEIIAKSLAV